MPHVSRHFSVVIHSMKLYEHCDACHTCKSSDVCAELQTRVPDGVNLKGLTCVKFLPTLFQHSMSTVMHAILAISLTCCTAYSVPECSFPLLSYTVRTSRNSVMHVKPCKPCELSCKIHS